MTVGDFHVNDALATVAELGRRRGYFAPRQFDSKWNVEENRTWLGPETLAQLLADTVPDAVVAGVGTGGTIAGVGQCFRTANPSCRIVAVEPSESCTLLCGEVGQHLIEGISDGFVPGHRRPAPAPHRPGRGHRQQRCDRRNAQAGLPAWPVRRAELRRQPARCPPAAGSPP